MQSAWRRIALWLGLLALGLASSVWQALAQHPARPSQGPVVVVAPIEGMIDLGLAPFIARALREARASGAAALVLDINTFGGRVDAAVQIRDALLASDIRTIAFINKRAISAGALISLATHKGFEPLTHSLEGCCSIQLS